MTVKEQLIQEAQALGIKTDKLTIAQLRQAIASTQTPVVEPAVTHTQTTEATVKPETDSDSEATFAKAGKRSQKQVEASEAKMRKQERKQEADQETTSQPPKPKAKPARPRSERRGKKYKTVAQKIDRQKSYEIDEALDLIIETGVTKFDSSIDLVVALGVDVKQANQNIRDFVVLPEGLGKDVRIAVFVDDKDVKATLEAGAQIAGKEVFLQQLDKGELNFDILITTPDLMMNLSKYAKLLGPRGLMPNHKSGTIVKNVVKAVQETKAGRVEYRVDDYGIIHLSIGKLSFGSGKLKNNLTTVLNSIRDNKPSNFKGVYIKKVHLTTTMGPSLEMSLASLK